MNTEDLDLQPYTAEDHARAYAWLCDTELRRLIGTGDPPTQETHEKWLEGMRDREDVLLLAITLDGRHIGNLYFVDIDTVHLRAEVQLFLGEECEAGRGLGTGVLRLAKIRGYKRLGLNRLYAYVYSYNPRAVRSFEKAGFHIEGCLREHRLRDGHFHDLIVLGSLSSND